MTSSKKVQNRTYKALFAVKGSKEELQTLVDALKLKGAEGTMPNETGRMLFRWLVIYADYETKTGKECKISYAFRSTNCSDTSRPKIILLTTALKRVAEDYYAKDGKILTFSDRVKNSLKLKS